MPAPWFELPELQSFSRTIPDGSFLFRQGEAGQTLYIVTSGRVALLAETEEDPRLVAWIEPGGILGEKALMTTGSHQRRFSAQARGPVKVLEIGGQDFETLRRSSPQVVIDLLKTMFLVTHQRFDRANYLARGLRSTDYAERLVHCLMYLRHSTTLKTENESAITADAIAELIDLDRAIIADALAWLGERKLVARHHSGSYLISDESKLIASTKDLRDFLDDRILEAATAA